MQKTAMGTGGQTGSALAMSLKSQIVVLYVCFLDTPNLFIAIHKTSFIDGDMCRPLTSQLTSSPAFTCNLISYYTPLGSLCMFMAPTLLLNGINFRSVKK